MSMSGPAPKDQVSGTPRQWRRGRIGMVLLVVAFVPALLAGRFPAVWDPLPTAVQWVGYGISGLCVLGILWLIWTAEYHDYSGYRREEGE